MSNRLMTKSSPYIRPRSLDKNGLLIAQFSRYQFIPSAKLFTQYISRPFLFKIYGCDLVVNLLDIIGYLSGLCLSARACREGEVRVKLADLPNSDSPGPMNNIRLRFHRCLRPSMMPKPP